MNENVNPSAPLPKGQLVQTRAQIPSALPAPADPPENWPTSLDYTTARGQAMIVRLSGPPTMTVAEAGEKEYAVVDYLIHPAESVDEDTGELSQFVRCSLLLADGRTISTSGPLVCRKWLLILRMCGQPSEDRPIAVRFARRSSRRQGRIYDDIELVVTNGGGQ
jgi:hypothetical protein